MKTCYICKASKEEHLFYRDKGSDDGITNACIECQKQKSKDYYSKVKETLTLEQKRLRKKAYVKWKANNADRYKELMDKHNKK